MKVLLICLMTVCLSWAASTGSRLSCNCGWRNTGRIVNGKETRKNEYPWMAALNTGFGCGASIITQWHVLTAAHCVQGIEKPSDIQVFVGRHYKFYGKYNGVENEHMVTHRAAKVIIHEKYKDNDDFDIAILVLATPIKFNQYIGPICMPNRKLDLVGKFVKVTGWGSSRGTADVNGLREVDLQVISNSECKKSWPEFPKDPIQICAYTPKKDSCSGDSGGPLVYLDPATNRYTQVALVSYGPDNCGTDPQPSVNTDVFAFNSWILNAIKKSHPEAHVCTKV